jgi:YHS domain-containing protein
LSARLCATALLAAVALLAGCAALVAQNPGTAMRPVNAARSGDDARLMLGGWDVVAYLGEGRAQPGSARYRVEFEGVVYHFASAEHRERFERDPARYQPAYHGYDATRMVYAIPELADPGVWLVIDGRVLLFADEASKAAFELDPAGNMVLANRYWKDEVAGTYSLVQAMWRRVDRVPHYRSRDELARAVAEAKAKPG